MHSCLLYQKQTILWDTCIADVANVTVYVSEMLPIVVDPTDQMLKYCSKVPASVGPGENAILACASAQTGRYLIVYAADNRAIVLCNVRAFGHSPRK